MWSKQDRFLRTLKPGQPPAIILGGGSTNGLAFIRSLGRKGIPVVAVDSSHGPTMRSRYCLTVDQEISGGDENGLVSLLLELGQKLPTSGVIIPTSDEYVLLVSRNRATLGKYFVFVIPDESTVERLVNKGFQYRFAASVGIQIPKTHHVQSPADIETAAADISYPCIMKPVYSHLWRQHLQKIGSKGLRKVAQIESPRQLFETYGRMAQSGVELVVQETIEGGEDQLYALYAYFNRDSEPLAVFIRRKLRQWPADFGTGCLSAGVHQQEVVDLGIRLLKGVGYQGLTNTEFKQDARDGQFKLIEVNVRSASQTSLAVDSGVDLPFVAYRDALGAPVEPVPSYKAGVKWINLASDFRSFRHHRSNRQLGFRSWIRSIKDARSHAYFAWDDPAPILFVAMGMAKDLVWHS